MINLELRRAIYKAFGLRPDGLQRLIIDISHDGSPTVYAQMVSTGGTVEEVIEHIQFNGFEMRKVEILESQPVKGVQLTTEDGAVSVYGAAVEYPDCTNDATCAVPELHLHTK